MKWLLFILVILVQTDSRWNDCFQSIVTTSAVCLNFMISASNFNLWVLISMHACSVLLFIIYLTSWPFTNACNDPLHVACYSQFKPCHNVRQVCEKTYKIIVMQPLVNDLPSKMKDALLLILVKLIFWSSNLLFKFNLIL